jgi:C-terminal domain of 1-Cys peroxiredoxin
MLKAMVYYPLTNGRSVDEILRIVQALQLNKKQGVATPEGRRPGDQVIQPPPVTLGDAEKRVADKSLDVTDWYFAKNGCSSTTCGSIAKSRPRSADPRGSSPSGSPAIFVYFAT